MTNLEMLGPRIKTLRNAAKGIAAVQHDNFFLYDYPAATYFTQMDDFFRNRQWDVYVHVVGGDRQHCLADDVATV